MFHIAMVTFKAIMRDRVFRGIAMIGIVFLAIPSMSSLSMRQVTELSITLSLSLISFFLMLLAVFLGGTSLWKDIERRYIYSVMGLPLSRRSYLLGKFIGIAAFVTLASLFLCVAACGAIWYASGIYPPFRPIAWTHILIAVFFDALKYILLIACAFLFSAMSTSFFFPLFCTISTFLVGSATQEVYDFVHTQAAQTLPAFIRTSAKMLYFILPNLAAFDLKVNAIYGVALSTNGLLLTLSYWVVYLLILLTLTSWIFSRRELQ